MRTRSNPWRSAVAIGAVLAIGWIAYGLQRPVPILDWFDLGIHEAGHLIAFPLPELAMFMAGSVLQIAVPLGLAWYFWLTQRDRAALAFCLGWAGTSARDVALYIADAKAQLLPLVGGGEHDWAYILGRLDALDRTESVAGFVSAVGVVLLGAGVIAGLVGIMQRPAPQPRPLPGSRAAAPRRMVTAFEPGPEGDPWYDAGR